MTSGTYNQIPISASEGDVFYITDKSVWIEYVNGVWHSTTTGFILQSEVVDLAETLSGISGGEVAWGGITGAIANQDDLVAVFSTKQNALGFTPEPENANIQAHIGSPHAPTNAQKNSDITKAEIEAKLTGEISSHTHAGGAGGLGYTLHVQALTSSPVDSGTLYFGMLPKAPVAAAGTSKVYIRKAGTIKMANIYCFSGTAGTAENWSLYIRKNNTTDTLIKTLSVALKERIFENSLLNIPVIAGDYIEIKAVNPVWATNPLTCIFGGYIYIE